VRLVIGPHLSVEELRFCTTTRHAAVIAFQWSVKGIKELFERPTIETDFTPNNFGNGARTQERAIES